MESLGLKELLEDPDISKESLSLNNLQSKPPNKTMKHLLIVLSILLLSSPVIGQSKPLGVVIPPTVMGNVSDSRKQILLNTLDEEISRYFDVSPPPKIESGELPVVSDVFQLQIIEEDGDTQLSLRWMS